MYKGQLFCTYHPVKMIRENMTVLVIINLLLLSLVSVSWGQSDSCSYQGQEVIGEFTIPGFCLLYRCIPGQGVTAIGCGIRVPPEGCFVQHPDTKDYPECCFTRLICPEANSIDIEQRLNATSNEELAFPKLTFGLPPAPFTPTTNGVSITDQQKYSTERPQLLKTLTPPAPDGATPVFRPKSAKKRPNNGYTEPPNVYSLSREENLGSGPYYYKK